MIGNYIKAVAPAVSRTTAQLMKTGQTTSYRTGDDGDLEAGRNVSFTVLAENNPFGNTNRFTDELGGQTYTKNIVIDWSTYNGSTVLGWRRTMTVAAWNAAVDGALVVSIAPFTSGWRLPNVVELISLQNYSLPNPMNYTPISIFENLWTSNTQASATGSKWYITSNGGIVPATLATSFRYIPCRTFTVTGTTLS
jgi:hypothetical protein